MLPLPFEHSLRNLPYALDAMLWICSTELAIYDLDATHWIFSTKLVKRFSCYAVKHSLRNLSHALLCFEHLLRNLPHALDATLWIFSGELVTRSWCYALNFLWETVSQAMAMAIAICAKAKPCWSNWQKTICWRIRLKRVAAKKEPNETVQTNKHEHVVNKKRVFKNIPSKIHRFLKQVLASCWRSSNPTGR